MLSVPVLNPILLSVNSVCQSVFFRQRAHGRVSMRTLCVCLFATVRGKSEIARARTAIYLVSQQSNLFRHVFDVYSGFFFMS